MTQAPYSPRPVRDTRNANDMVLAPTANKDRLMLAVSKTDQGYAAAIDIGVNLKTVPVLTCTEVHPYLSGRRGVPLWGKY